MPDGVDVGAVNGGGMNDTGPYLSIAALCEDWNIDPQTRMLTLSRVFGMTIASIDRNFRPGNIAKADKQLTLFLRFTSGRFEGAKKLEVRAPSLGIESIPFQMECLGDASPIDAPVPLRVESTNDGLHWIDVRLDDGQ